MNLLSIDTELGQIRVYVCTPGSKPKKVYRVDVTPYTRDMLWDLDEVERFRLDPMKMVQAAQGEPPEAA